jgi:hypothetical protein
MHTPPRIHLAPAAVGAALAILFASPAAVVGGEAGDVVQQPIPEVEVGAVVVEAQPPPPEPTVEELMVRFRERLRTERLLAPIERPLAGGLVEVTTRFGRFCVPGVTPFNWSDLTGSFGLASFCAYY